MQLVLVHSGGYSLLLDLTLIKPQFGLGWYLNYLLLWYVVFWLIHMIPVLAKNKKYRVHAFVLVSLMLLVYFNFTSSIRFEQSFSFLIGIWLANYDEELCSEGVKIGKHKITKDKMVKPSFGIISLFIALVILVLKQFDLIREHSDTMMNIVDLGIKLFSSVGILICVLVFDEMKGGFSRFWYLIKRILTPLGKASFELYLVHGYALSVFNFNLSNGLCVLDFLAISIIGTIAFHLVNSWLGRALKGKFITEVAGEAK